MKKIAKAKKKTAPPNNADLRRWCIEMAMRWPVYEDRDGYGANGVYTQGGGRIARTDANIIGRATVILDWVQG